jgi:hypothetical protein
MKTQQFLVGVSVKIKEPRRCSVYKLREIPMTGGDACLFSIVADCLLGVNVLCSVKLTNKKEARPKLCSKSDASY